MEADRVNNSGLNNLLPWEHTPSHSNGLSGVTVGDVLRTLTRGGGKENNKEVEEEEDEEDDEKKRERRERVGFELVKARLLPQCYTFLLTRW